MGCSEVVADAPQPRKQSSLPLPGRFRENQRGARCKQRPHHRDGILPILLAQQCPTEGAGGDQIVKGHALGRAYSSAN